MQGSRDELDALVLVFVVARYESPPTPFERLSNPQQSIFQPPKVNARGRACRWSVSGDSKQCLKRLSHENRNGTSAELSPERFRISIPPPRVDSQKSIYPPKVNFCPTPQESVLASCCRANSAHIRQSRPHCGLGLSHFSGGISSTLLRCSLLARYESPQTPPERLAVLRAVKSGCRVYRRTSLLKEPPPP